MTPSPVGRPPRLVALFAALALVAGACNNQAGQSVGASPTTQASGDGPAATTAIPTAASPAGPSGEPSPAEGEFTNPVIADNYPDPFVMKDEGMYYLYATTNVVDRIQGARSPDIVTWEKLGEMLEQLPERSSGATWAPEVAKTRGGYVM